MPNAKVLSEKQAIVAALTEQLKNASSGVLVNYKGITVAEDTALRAELRKNDVEYAVVKNTLVRFALDEVNLKELDDVLHGTTSLAISTGDPIAPMRVVNQFAKKLGDGKFNIKAGFMEGKVISLEEIMALSDRIAVLFAGRIVGVLTRQEATVEKIGLLMGGITGKEAVR